jgi:asparagine synthase (glutamine-hydrolysing)
MCGIAGIFNVDGAPVAPEPLEAMATAMRHRGPDAAGVWRDGMIGLSHRRLSVLDLAGGSQPMELPGGGAWIVFNGEIYNHVELRRALEARDVVFHTRSDTEVLLQLYAECGVRLLDHLEGMFAFAIWDVARRRLFLARDRFGKKPLHYFFRGGRFAFASELGALRRAPGCPDTLDPQALHDYLSLQCIPAPATVYRGVRKLPPGHFMLVENGARQEPDPRCYWSLSFTEKTNLSFAAAAAGLRERLAAAVRRRLVADVPLGAFLSGGVDSTVVAALMRQASGRPPLTFTIGFAEPRYDERRFAALAAARIGTDHHEREVRADDFDLVRVLAAHLGEPFADASLLPTYQLSRFARERVTVALGGDGADELLGGYERYAVMRWLRRAALLPASWRRALATAAARRLPAGLDERSTAARVRRALLLLAQPDAPACYEALLSRFPETLKRELAGAGLRDGAPAVTGRLIRDVFAMATSANPDEVPAEADVSTYLPDDILCKVDTASMAASLEVRCPFLDREVAEFAAALPWRFKQTGHQRKRLLLAAAADLIPPEIRQRRKAGFGVPLAAWFRGGWQAPLREVLLDPGAARAGYFRPPVVERLIREHTAGLADHSYPLWTLLIFELWRTSRP